jgi:hypothetical protein
METRLEDVNARDHVVLYGDTHRHRPPSVDQINRRKGRKAGCLMAVKPSVDEINES